MSDREAFLTKRLAERSEELERLRLGIQDYLDGNYGPTIIGKIAKCPHGRFGYEDCGNCIDEYFMKLLANGEQADAQAEKD